jgi:cobalamin-dependent methionine synthase I
VRWIKKEFKGVKVSGGISNLSYSFRGNNIIRGSFTFGIFVLCNKVGFGSWDSKCGYDRYI